LDGDRKHSRDYLFPFFVLCHGSIAYTSETHGAFYGALKNAFIEDNPQWKKVPHDWHDHLALYWAIAASCAGQEMDVVKSIRGFDLEPTMAWLDGVQDRFI